MINFADVLVLSPAKIEKTRVNCGTCPVNMACILGQGGTGWKFNCCGSTGYVLDDATVAIDCANNAFEQNEDAKSWKLCPMCSGGIMEVVERARKDGGHKNLYLLTVYAKVPLEDRLKLWKEKQAYAKSILADEAQRRTA